MAPPGAQPDLVCTLSSSRKILQTVVKADDASPGPCSHARNDSVATQATLVADGAQPGANAAGRALKGANSNDDVHVVDNQRFRVTAGTPAGPTAATTAVQTGLPTAVAPQNVPVITAAALAVADPTTAAVAGPNEGPSGAHVADAAACVANGYEDSSDDEFDYDQLDYENVFCLPPGQKMIRIPIGQTGPDDWVDQHGHAWRAVRIDDLVDEDEDWVLSGGAGDDDDANSHGNDDDNANANDDADKGANDNGDDDEEGGNDSDLASDWQPPAVLPEGPDAAGTIGCKDVRTEYNRERVAKETVAVSKVAPTVPLPPNFVPVPLRPEPDNILRPPWWDEELEKHIAAPLAPPDDAPPVPRASKRKRDDDDDDDEPAPHAPKKARRGKAFDRVIAWIDGVSGPCARLTDGRRDELAIANANADDAEGAASVDVDVDSQNNSQNAGEAGTIDEYNEDADWVLQPCFYE